MPAAEPMDSHNEVRARWTAPRRNEWSAGPIAVRRSARFRGRPNVALEPRGAATDLRRTEAIDAAYREFGTPLLRFAARSLGDRGLAEEAVQETFVRAWRRADRYDASRAPLQAWLFAICRNVIIDMSRARKVRPAVTDGSVAADNRANDGEVDAVEKMLQSAALEEALRRVDPEHRKVLIEVMLLDRPQEAVAADLGVPVGTVKSRVFYGLRSLRKSLQAIGWNDD